MTENRTTMPEDYQFNLSDFAFFLSVMSNKKAYQNVLSIIMDEPDIQVEEVKVEPVVLNKFGKRAIRLDAWARTSDERHFDVEMQNDTKSDDVRKRSRYYQSLMDSPLLKAGKKTKYKMLPSTVIIFITQEDIFGRDIVKYTFIEQCEEIKDLKLEDGTTKIFLNMTSKNGAPELVSMLQYMKETRIDNPEIVVKDSRLLELDGIVNEVKESKEWEAVKMNILEIGKEIGIELGERQTLKKQIQKKLTKGCSLEEIVEMLEIDMNMVQELIAEMEEK